MGVAVSIQKLVEGYIGGGGSDGEHSSDFPLFMDSSDFPLFSDLSDLAPGGGSNGARGGARCAGVRPSRMG